jgi:GNAT superfamily N-acetyltransferase
MMDSRNFTVALGHGVATPPASPLAGQITNASVAQLVEQLTLNQLVLGSNPSRGTFFFTVQLPLGSFSHFYEAFPLRRTCRRPGISGDRFKSPPRTINRMIQIRLATSLDIPDLARIFLSARRSAFHWCDPSVFKLDDFSDQTAGEVIYLAHDECSGILGFVSIWQEDAFVHHLFVAPEHQGKGIGTMLLQSLHSWLPLPYRLKCLCENSAAHGFYLKSGWKELGKGADPLGDYTVMELGELHPRHRAGDSVDFAGLL